MAPNVPGCKRRFASPNKQTARFAGLANCGVVRRGNGAKRNDLAERSPSRRKAAKRLQSCYVPYLAFFILLINNNTPIPVSIIPIALNHNG